MHIQTVLGSIEPSLIGHAQCHEHILLAKGKSYEINPALCIDDVEKSLVELKRYGAKGGSLIVDAQPGGCGRMSNELAGISEEAKVYIVASTGFHKLMFYPEGHWIHNITTDGLALYMVTELTEGMYINGDDNYPAHISNHKAGMIKMALDKEGLSERYKRIFDAGIKASINTGAPIQCHTENAEQGPIIAAYLLEAGVLPHNIIIAHLDRDETMVDAIMRTAKQGVYLQFDTIGRFKYHDDLSEIELIKNLIEAGYENQLLIGLDTTRARLLAYDGEIGLDYILDTFNPMMLEKGISSESIEKITITNPQKALAFI